MSTFFTRLWSRRWLRALTWTLITLITFWVLLAVVLKWSGQRRWLRLTQELEAKGETLDFFKLQPPPIADERNFAAIEPLNGIRLGPGDSPEAKAAEAKRDRIQKACQLYTSKNDPGKTPPRPEPLAKAEPPSLATLIALLPDLPKLKLTATSDAAALRQSIEREVPFLAELTAAALTRPDVDYLPRWDKIHVPETLFALPVPHCSQTQALSRLLSLHGLACIESGDAEAAVTDVITVLRLAEGHFKEPLLIGHLVGASVQQIAAELAWVLLQRRSLNDAQLQVLQRAFSRVDLAASLLLGMRGEMAAAADMGEYLEKSADGLSLLQMMNERDQTSVPQGLVGRLFPSGFFTHSKVSLVKAEWEHLVRPLHEQALKNVLASAGSAETWLKSISLLKRPDLFLARMALPAVSTMRISSAYAENLRRQVLLACALERHFIQHGSYPANLDTLEASTLAGAAKTAFDESPMHYRVSSDGRYRLWHHGPDGKDDDGTLAGEKGSQAESKPRTAQYLGDWTWRYEPVKR